MDWSGGVGGSIGGIYVSVRAGHGGHRGPSMSYCNVLFFAHGTILIVDLLSSYFEKSAPARPLLIIPAGLGVVLGAHGNYLGIVGRIFCFCGTGDDSTIKRGRGVCSNVDFSIAKCGNLQLGAGRVPHNNSGPIPRG